MKTSNDAFNAHRNYIAIKAFFCIGGARFLLSYTSTNYYVLCKRIVVL